MPSKLATLRIVCKVSLKLTLEFVNGIDFLHNLSMQMMSKLPQAAAACGSFADPFGATMSLLQHPEHPAARQKVDQGDWIHEEIQRLVPGIRYQQCLVLQSTICAAYGPQQADPWLGCNTVNCTVHEAQEHEVQEHCMN